MFKLLSKESNIFSIPLYIGFLLLVVIAFNILEFSSLEAVSALITFTGIALGYFLFNKIDLNYQTHVPLFLYTFFVFALYPGNLDIGISVALLTNSFLLLILTSTDDYIRKSSYLVIGAILAINYIVLPTTWPMIIFVLFHIVGTSGRVGLNVFRLLFGFLLVILTYLGIMYFLGFTAVDPSYFPFSRSGFLKSFSPYIYLLPVAILLVISVMNHFQHYNEKSPASRYKYTFLLVFSLAQLVTLVLYMGSNFGYLLLLSLPASIILSRYLKFLPKSWMQEAGLWLIILTLLIFKASTYVEIANFI